MLQRKLTLIRTPEDVRILEERLLSRLDGTLLALDVEEDRMMHYAPRIALLQLSWDDEDAIIDPLRLPADELNPLIEALCLRPERILMHGAQNDVTGLKRDFGVGPERLLDTQFAARFAGRRAFGLATLLLDMLDIKAEKETRMSDWTQRPLSDEQIAYARRDTAYLGEIAAQLLEEAETAGFSDAVAEESAALADQPAGNHRFDPHGWRGIKGAGSLDDAAQRRAAMLWTWREETARDHDRHTTRVLPPKLLLMLAERGPSALERDGSRLMKKIGRFIDKAEICALLADPPPIDESASPDGRSRSGGSTRPPWYRNGEFDERVERLQAWRKRTSQESGLESGLLAPRSLLEQLADIDEPSHEAIASIPDIRTWRVSRWADEWLEIL